MEDKYTNALNNLATENNKDNGALENYQTIQNLIERYKTIVKAYYDCANYKIGDYELIMIVGATTHDEVVNQNDNS